MGLISTAIKMAYEDNESKDAKLKFIKEVSEEFHEIIELDKGFKWRTKIEEELVLDLPNEVEFYVKLQDNKVIYGYTGLRGWKVAEKVSPTDKCDIGQLLLKALGK